MSRHKINLTVKGLLISIGLVSLIFYIATGGDRARVRLWEEYQTVLSEALGLADISYWTWDRKRDALHWSPRLYELYGLESWEQRPVTYDDWLSVVHPDDRERADGVCTDLAILGGSYELRYRVIDEEGQIRSIRETAALKEGGRYMVGVCLPDAK